MHKASFFFFSFFSWNTDATRRQEIITLSGLQATQRYDKYLGLPALVAKSRTQAFQCIKDKVRNRLNNWKLKFLYQSGKEILLKEVIQAIPTYSMRDFKLQQKLCKEISGLMKNFW